MNCKSEFYLYYDLYLLCDIVLLLMKNVLSMMMILLWIIKEYNLKYGTIIIVMDVLIREKLLRLTMDFGYLMYSHSLVPVIDL